MIGKIVNNYEIKSLLGEGGMGMVYLAEHPYIRRKAAVKVLRRVFAEDAGLVSRFMNEARAANAVKHPNIIDIIDVGILPEGLPYLMMEFLDGESLCTRLARLGRLEVEPALEIARQIGDALTATHAAGIVHRDLKPDNLFIVRDGTIPGAERVKVLDFGIAKLRGDIGGASKTSTGMLMGTPAYMSPEQCRGLVSEIDQRTDVYATGIILYEMLCGAPPFSSEGAGEMLIMHTSVVPEPPRDRNPQIPPHIQTAILRALAKKAHDRFPDMRAFVAALEPPSLATILSDAPRTTPRKVAEESDRASNVEPPLQTRPRVGHTTTFRAHAAELTPHPESSGASRKIWIGASVTLVLAAAVFGGVMGRRKQAPISRESVPVSSARSAGEAVKPISIPVPQPTVPVPPSIAPVPKPSLVERPVKSTAPALRKRPARGPSPLSNSDPAVTPLPDPPPSSPPSPPTAPLAPTAASAAGGKVGPVAPSAPNKRKTRRW